MQLTLPFARHCSFLQEDFIITQANSTAYQSILQFQKWPGRRMLLLGPRASGKTHLARILQNNLGGIFITADDLNFWHDLSLNYHSCIIIEDIDLLPYNLHNELFHMINFCNHRKIYLLYTSTQPIVTNLPDLESRLQATYTIKISNMDDKTLEGVLRKQLQDVQLTISEDLLKFTLRHVRRNFSYIRNFITTLDQYCMQHHTKISLATLQYCLTKANEMENNNYTVN